MDLRTTKAFLSLLITLIPFVSISRTTAFPTKLSQCKPNETICTATDANGLGGTVSICDNGVWSTLTTCIAYERCVGKPFADCIWNAPENIEESFYTMRMRKDKSGEEIVEVNLLALIVTGRPRKYRC